ncbi:transcriptional regulator [Desulfosporosinus acidiphilus SJ4]|uniref:Transcriptional regulator n=1 Tax=Desulfosporosinus acidiphilus (strain DSM 22704 / JCM 16185 / SJ4) TaxID=646529 RepID=I4D6D3_DESAJ|nr:TetR/AcrR family transcriptional regulator [Desulfosporosinus acidiphilus]AFM41357.1 transcriptional regulator [Desulfosporosinus acidiphilus SJ4]
MLKFLELDKLKQDRIINAAMKEFALKGYKNASTNEIVKEAGISKGLLFHYFTNKKSLFLYLYNYSLETFTMEFFARINLLEKDIFKRIRQMALLKIGLIKKYPEIYNFLYTAVLEEAQEIKDDLEQKNKQILNDNYAKLFRDIDVDKFKDTFEIDKTKNIVIWTIEGYSNQILAKIKSQHLTDLDYEEISKELDVYLKYLEIAFYK